MNTLVVYDSAYGNTRLVADAVARALGGPQAQATLVSDVTPAQLSRLELLVVGSPTQKFRPLPSLIRWIQSLAPDGLRGVRVAAFDTRLDVAAVGSRMLSFLVGVQGAGAYAASHLARDLQRRGGYLALAPTGFEVEGQEGPLKPGELQRAAEWVGALAAPSARAPVAASPSA